MELIIPDIRAKSLGAALKMYLGEDPSENKCGPKTNLTIY